MVWAMVANSNEHFVEFISIRDLNFAISLTC